MALAASDCRGPEILRKWQRSLFDCSPVGCGVKIGPSVQLQLLNSLDTSSFFAPGPVRSNQVSKSPHREPARRTGRHDPAGHKVLRRVGIGGTGETATGCEWRRDQSSSPAPL